MTGRANIADILCIGAQRAMTSWLHHVLSAHPRTWAFPDFGPVTSTAKEAHFWDWNRHRGVDWYRVLMTPLDDPTRLSLDFTPDYACLSEAQIAECKVLNPQARVIYILRDPLARAASALRMHRFWASGASAAAQQSIEFDAAFPEHIRQAAIASHGDYWGNYQRWKQHYPDLLVLSFEALCADPAAGLAQVMAHCGLSGADLEGAARDTFDQRLGQPLWQTPRFAIDQDALHFLYGATWPEREAIRTGLGLTFTEGQTLLAPTLDGDRTAP